MKRIILALLALSLSVVVSAQDQASKMEYHKQKAQVFQDSLATAFSTPGKSPIPENELADFGGLEFFDINPTYTVTATLKRFESPEVIEMATSSDQTRKYAVYGEVSFELKGRSYTLNVYQGLRHRNHPLYKNLLFFPFNDASNGVNSYGGGRFLDLRIPQGNTLIIDFNLAYNPYCAYTTGYSCAVPPKGQYIDLEVWAGASYTDKH